MWLAEAEEFFKCYLPYYLLVFLPIFIIMCPVNPVSASHEFPVYRMQHYDLHGVPHGCRSAVVNLEARSLNDWSTSRHCVLARMLDLTVNQYHDVRNKAGALVIVLPENMSNLTLSEQQHIFELESQMFAQEATIPIYFTHSNAEINAIMQDLTLAANNNVSNSVDDLSKPATEALFASVAANGYQIVISPSPSASLMNDVKVATIHGHLSGYNPNGKLLTIAIVAHYDSFSVAPDLSFGADANASGVLILLELVRLFSTLYSDTRTQGKYNLLFLLTGGGKIINYQGSKKWLEDQFETSLNGVGGGAAATILQDAAFVMCLDTMANSDMLYMHVSKPPKEASHAARFFKKLKSAMEKESNGNDVEGVHKKINLADDLLAWEHERFSIRRLPAFTLSTVKNYRDSTRNTLLDTAGNFHFDRLLQHTKVIAEALSNHIYNVSNSFQGEIFSKSLAIDENYMRSWFNYLTSQPRSAQLLAHKHNSLVNHLKDNFDRYLQDVKVSYATPDKRDPDFQFYEGTSATMNVYNVKPAVFDLILTFAIIIYLFAAYFCIIYFSRIYAVACSITTPKIIQANGSQNATNNISSHSFSSASNKKTN